MPLSEADTRAKLIDPALHARGWTEDHISREVAAPRVEIVGGEARRASQRGRMDYVLRVIVRPDTQPVAVAIVEAKAEDKDPGMGMEQAQRYACRLNVPFVVSTNGHRFVLCETGPGITTGPYALSRFPGPDEIRARYEETAGFSLDDPLAAPLLRPYPGGDAARRYYADAAIRAVLEKFARGEKRALLSLATGTGKTRIAALLLRKIADAGDLRRALFVCDRDELRTQGHGQLFQWFQTDAAMASAGNPQMNARIVVATYQTLNVSSEEDDASFLTDNYPEDYFSHIVIDECHRSAWGKWSLILTRNPNAYQVGLTATPRQIIGGSEGERAEDNEISANNVRHFGPPVYEYDLAEAIDDGYLAACEVVRRVVDLDQTGLTRERIEQSTLQFVDARTGELLPMAAEAREVYLAPSFERNIQLPDRVQAMCEDLFSLLVQSGGPEQKTIIFCVRDTHAQTVANVMNNLYAEWRAGGHGRGDRPVAPTPRANPYAFKCTASVGGADYIKDLRGLGRSHFVATTVDLLTTGVDVPNVRNIVFFRYVRSPIAFYQMVGRGTRIDETSGKLMFRVYDYTDATRLFGHTFATRARPGTGDPPAAPTGEAERIVRVEDGLEVHVSGEGTYIVVNENGRAMPITVGEYRERIAGRLTGRAASIDEFRRLWVVPNSRRELLDALPNGENGARTLRDLTNMGEYDLYDVLSGAAYGTHPRTRPERAEAFEYKNRGWLASLPEAAAATLEALAGQFEAGGTDALENPRVFETEAVRRAGGIGALQKLGEPGSVLTKTKERLFAA